MPPTSRDMPMRETVSGKDFLVVVLYCKEVGSLMPRAIGVTEVAENLEGVASFNERMFIDFNFAESQEMFIKVFAAGSRSALSGLHTTLEKSNFLEGQERFIVGETSFLLANLIAEKNGDYITTIRSPNGVIVCGRGPNSHDSRIVISCQEILLNNRMAELDCCCDISPPANPSCLPRLLDGRAQYMLTSTCKRDECADWSKTFASNYSRGDHPHWHINGVSMNQLCSRSKVKGFTLKLWKKAFGGKIILLGQKEISLNAIADVLTDDQEPNTTSEDTEEKSPEPSCKFDMISPFDENVVPAVLNIRSLKARREFSFMEYVRSGLALDITVAVDMHKSNSRKGNPKNNLHYVDAKKTSSNPYQHAIHCILSYFSPYAKDQFNVVGFAGVIGETEGICKSLFSLESLECSLGSKVDGVASVLDVYTKSLGFCLPGASRALAPLLNSVADQAKRPFTETDQHYSLLIVFLNGSPSDMRDVKHALEAASSTPMSIIIVGVGSKMCSGSFMALKRLIGKTSSSRGTQKIHIQFIDWHSLADNQMHNACKEVVENVPVNVEATLRKLGFRPFFTRPDRPLMLDSQLTNYKMSNAAIARKVSMSRLRRGSTSKISKKVSEPSGIGPKAEGKRRGSMPLAHVDSISSSKRGEEAKGSIHDETEVADVSSGKESFHENQQDIPNDMIDEEEHFLFEREDYSGASDEDDLNSSERGAFGPSLGDDNITFFTKQQQEQSRKAMEANSIREKYRSSEKTKALRLRSQSSLRNAVQKKLSVSAYDWKLKSSVVLSTNTELRHKSYFSNPHRSSVLRTVKSDYGGAPPKRHLLT